MLLSAYDTHEKKNIICSFGNGTGTVWMFGKKSI